MAVEVEWLLYKPDDPECQLDRAFALVLLVFLDDGEFVAAETGQHVGIAQRRTQPLRDLDQQLVARRMPQRVVDVLEPVEVEHQDGESGAMTLQPLAGIFEFFGEQRAVREAGERMMLRKERDPLFIP